MFVSPIFTLLCLQTITVLLIRIVVFGLEQRPLSSSKGARSPSPSTTTLFSLCSDLTYGEKGEEEKGGPTWR